MRFLLDENVHRGLYSFLSKSGHDAKLSPKTIRNSKVFRLAVKEKRTLITRDSDFLHSPYASSKHFGIIILRIDPGNLKTQQKILSDLLEKFSEEEIKREMFLLKENEIIPFESRE